VRKPSASARTALMSTAFCHNAIASDHRVPSRCSVESFLPSSSFLNRARYQSLVGRQLHRPRSQTVPPHPYTHTSKTHARFGSAVIGGREESSSRTLQRGVTISTPFFSWWNLSIDRTFPDACRARVCTALQWPIKVNSPNCMAAPSDYSTCLLQRKLVNTFTLPC
jgi:hypothetical protein